MAGLFARVAGESSGPYPESEIIELVSKYGDHVEIYEKGPDVWVKASQSDFAQHVPANPQTPARGSNATANTQVQASGGVSSLTVFGLGLAGIVLVSTIVFVSSRSSSPPAKPAEVKSYAPVPDPPPVERTLAQRLADSTDVKGALALLQPSFKDTHNESDPAALLFAMWCTNRLDWNAFTLLAETTHAKVMKDPDAERGKRLCASGSIVEIAVDRSSGQPIYAGGLVTPSVNIIRFIAVRSTGELVQKSPARICGVVTGRETYSNSGGGVTHAVKVVGMFDLPENKKPLTAN